MRRYVPLLEDDASILYLSIPAVGSMDTAGNAQGTERTRACALSTLDPCPYRHDRRVRGPL